MNLAREGDPRLGLRRILPEPLQNGLGFDERRERFNGQIIDASVDQRHQTRSVPLDEIGLRHRIGVRSRVLGTIGAARTVRTHRTRHFRITCVHQTQLMNGTRQLIEKD